MFTHARKRFPHRLELIEKQKQVDSTEAYRWSKEIDDAVVKPE